jgi:hypothetical protein
LLVYSWQGLRRHALYPRPARACPKQRDLAECDYNASKATTGDGKAPKTTGDAVGDGVVRGMEKSDLMKKCMRVRGYSG